MIGVFLAIAIVLVIVALVIRDQTEVKLSQMRAQFMALRSEEKRLGEERTELERLIAQTGDALMRADSRQRDAEDAHQALVEMLDKMGEDDEEGAGDDAEIRVAPDRFAEND